MESCHCFLEITSQAFNYEGIHRYNDDFSLIISFTQKLISIIVILLSLIYIYHCIKHRKFLTFINESIFNYLDFVIPELEKSTQNIIRPMTHTKSNTNKSISLIIMNENDTSEFKTTLISHNLEEKLESEIGEKADFFKNLSPEFDLRENTGPFFSRNDLDSSLLNRESPHIIEKKKKVSFFENYQKDIMDPERNNSNTIYLEKRKSEESFKNFCPTLKSFENSSPLILGIIKKNKKGKEKKNEGLRCTEIADKINLVIKPLIKIDDSFNNSNKMHKIGSGQAKQKKNKKKIENESGFNNEDYYEPKYICNCFECCFECCPNFLIRNLIEPMKEFFERTLLKLQLILMKHSKILCYFLISFTPFLDNSLGNVLSIFISGCFKDKMGDYYFQILYAIYSIFEVSFGSLFFFACVFITSFISTKRELLEIHSNDRLARGYLVYYHVKKSFIFSLFHFVFQFALKGIFLINRSFFSTTMGNDTVIFCLLKNTFYFCFISSKYPNFRNINLIKHDDYVLKSQFKYFNIQNLLVKYLPKAKALYDGLKNDETPGDPIENLDKYLENRLTDAKENLNAELKIIDQQKFQVIVRNRGVSPIIPIALMWYIMIDSFFSVIIAIVFLLRLNMKEYIPEKLFKICSFLEILLNVLEFILLPWLIRITLQTRTFVEYEES